MSDDAIWFVRGFITGAMTAFLIGVWHIRLMRTTRETIVTEVVRTEKNTQQETT